MSEPDPNVYTKIEIWKIYDLKWNGTGDGYKWFYYDTGVKGHWFDDQLLSYTEGQKK